MNMFCVLIDWEDGVLVLCPQGEIDFHTAPALTEAVREAEGPWRDVVVDEAVRDAEGPWRDVVVDLSGVPFMDSSGVHALVDVLHRCRARGGRLTARGVREQPARLLDLVGLTGVFTAAN